MVRIKCAECKDFDLCVECFAFGVEVVPHKNSHSYRVVDRVRTPIFEEGWGADEELLLLDAIDTHGFGNWGEVEKDVCKPKEVCRAHYETFYLGSRCAPLPDLTAKLRTAKDMELMKQEKDRAKKPKPKKSKDKAGSKAKLKPSGLSALVGYKEKRGDFETEYENDSENILKDMEFREDDTKWERELKLKVVEIYNSKLDARLERKNFILERGLLHKKEKKRTKEEMEIVNTMKVFARFHSQEAHEAFVQGLINEQKLRKRIELLQAHRMNGVKTLAEVEEIEDRKRQGLPPEGHKGKRERKATVDSSTGLPQLDISNMEGLELLAKEEKQLCIQLGLIPHQYIVIKERLIRESYNRGWLQPGQARQLIKIDVNKTDKIFDFFVSVGWVHSIPDDMKGDDNGTEAALQPTAPAAPVQYAAQHYPAAQYGRMPQMHQSMIQPQMQPMQGQYNQPMGQASSSNSSQQMLMQQSQQAMQAQMSGHLLGQQARYQTQQQYNYPTQQTL